MAFGTVADLKPFVNRLDADASFADEMASMVRTIIYHERDGLSRLELIELIETAVAGPEMEDAGAPEVREAVRRLMVFIESVFRTRRNPGAVSVESAMPVAAPEPEPQERKAAEVAVAAPVEEMAAVVAAEPASPAHPTLDVFYRARMVAEEQEAEALAEERKVQGIEKREADGAAEAETVLPTDLHWHVPFEDFGDRETAERGSPAWLWVAGICALLLAFGGGVFVHQRLIVPLRALNTPYETPPPEAQKQPSTVPAPPAASAAQTAGAEDASLVTKGARGVKKGAASVPVSDVTQLPRYMAPATIGASPAVMAAHLVYAPPLSYPMMAEMTRTQGKVTVEAVVGKSGRVIRAQVVGGHRLLRGAAVREVYARRYRPYLVNDRPTNVATMVTVDFKLRR